MFSSSRGKAESPNSSESALRIAGKSFKSRFFIISFALILTIGIAVAYYIQSRIEAVLLSSYVKNVAVCASANVSGHLSAADFSEPLTGKRYDEFHRFMKEYFIAEDVVRAKLWSPNGTIIYSDDRSIVGKKFSDDEVREAMKGTVKVEIVDDVEEYENTNTKYGSLISVYMPVEKNGKTVGVYEVYNSTAPLQHQVDLSRMAIFGGLGFLLIFLFGLVQVGSALLVKQNLGLRRLSSRLDILAKTDGLTGLKNHRHFQEMLEKEIRRAARLGYDLSLLMVDLDGFKETNDQYGHQTGDVVLKEVSSCIDNNVRDVDFCARYGGDEIVVILPGADAKEATMVAERLRHAISNLGITHDGKPVDISASFGIADYPYSASDKNSLIAAADSALLLAKRRGRDQVCNFRQLEGIEIQSEDIDRLFHRLQHANLTTLKALAAAVDNLDGQPGKHSISSNVIERFIDMLNLSDEDSEALNKVLALYDVGKIAIPEKILSKTTSLTENEIEILKKHPQFSQKMLATADEMQRTLTAVLYHHERWDGQGYPHGLKARNIPFLARVIHIIDAFESMLQDRPYRKALSLEQAIEELRRNKGTQFDPQLVDIFIESLNLGEKAGRKTVFNKPGSKTTAGKSEDSKKNRAGLMSSVKTR